MTSFLGTAMTYDEVGNPLHYNNIYDFTWQNGRELATATIGSKILSFTYNADSIRTSKTVNGVKHTYTLNGSQIVSEQWSDKLLVFLYDESGSPIGMQYRTNNMAEGMFYTYLFEKNLQGDIIAVYNTSGTKLISYYYDAWGNFVKTTHNISGTNVGAQYNPFTYRGYYYDTELDFYYLQSRYYDLEVGRFISPDSFDIIWATPSDLYDINLYSYCDNNPVMRIDNGGMFWDTIFDVGSLIVSVVEVIANPADPWAWAGLAGDTIDLIPFVSGVGEVTRAVKTTVKVADKADNVVDAAKAIYKGADAASDIRKATGSYEIIYKSGKNYVGKGGFARAINSAQRNASKYSDEVISISWRSAPNSKVAFYDEYIRMRARGVNNNYTYNRIWSLGRSSYINGLKNVFR